MRLVGLVVDDRRKCVGVSRSALDQHGEVIPFGDQGEQALDGQMGDRVGLEGHPLDRDVPSLQPLQGKGDGGRTLAEVDDADVRPEGIGERETMERPQRHVAVPIVDGDRCGPEHFAAAHTVDRGGDPNGALAERLYLHGRKGGLQPERLGRHVAESLGAVGGKRQQNGGRRRGGEGKGDGDLVVHVVDEIDVGFPADAVCPTDAAHHRHQHADTLGRVVRSGRGDGGQAHGQSDQNSRHLPVGTNVTPDSFQTKCGRSIRRATTTSFSIVVKRRRW